MFSSAEGLDATIAPVVIGAKRYRAADSAGGRRGAEGQQDRQLAKRHARSFVLFKGDMAAYVRLRLSWRGIFDYGNTAALSKSGCCILPEAPAAGCLEFGRRRDGWISPVVLTAHSKPRAAAMTFNADPAPTSSWHHRLV